MTGLKRNSKLYLLLMVGIISAFGPFVTDFYLPALPSLSHFFQTTTSLAQLSLTFSMIGLGVGQLVFGPLSDKYGRKRPLLLSLVLFCFSTLGCLFSPEIYSFVFFRLLQGLAGAGGLVIARSIAIDLHQGKELAQFFSLLSLVQGLAPIAAPVLGGFVLEVTDWKGIFWLLLIIGMGIIVLLLPFRESHPAELRFKGNVWATFRNYLPLFRHRQFMQFVLVQAFAMGVMFSYIAASPFIFQNHFGVSPLVYSLCFGVNAVAIMAGSILVSAFRQPLQALQVGSWGFLLMSLVVGGTLLTAETYVTAEVSLFFFLMFLGLILPSSTTLALELERENSGNASALFGFLMFLFGGVLSPLTGLGNIIYTTALLMVACSVCAWAFTVVAGKELLPSMVWMRVMHRN